jgi:hypothetical protein
MSEDKRSKPDKRHEPQLTEDDIAQARLGGPRGSPELPPAKMTPQRCKKTPQDVDPGHTA